MVKSWIMMEAVIYGVILKAKMVNWLKEPPENRSNKSNNPVSPVNTCARAERLIPGTGMLEPILKTTSISRVKIILLLISATLKACEIVLSISILNHLCLSSGRFNFFDCRLGEFVSFHSDGIVQSSVSENLDAVLNLLYHSCFFQ